MIKNKIKLKAFTVTEALICFFIIGLIFVATVTNIKTNDNYDKLYWQAFNTLYQASKTAYNEFENKESYKATWPNNNEKYPSFLKVDNEPENKFCKRIVKYINTLEESSNCGVELINPMYELTSIKGQHGVDFYEGYYSSNEEDADGNKRKEHIPSFTAINGQKYFIFPLLKANYMPEKGNPYETKEKESFRFVVVDLNGDAKPNTQFIKGKRNPDIVLFAIDSEGNVIPLGLPEFSKAYISAMVTYPNYVKSNGMPVYSEQHSNYDTLWVTKRNAWGVGCSAENGALFAQTISQYEALSQSTKFYFNAYNCRGKIGEAQYEVTGQKRNQELKCGEGSKVDEDYVYLVNQFLYNDVGSTITYTNSNDEERKKLRFDECPGLISEFGCISVEKKDMAPTCGIDFKH